MLVVSLSGCVGSPTDAHLADLERQIHELQQLVAEQQQINRNLIGTDRNLTEAQLSWACAAQTALCATTRELYADLPWRKP